MACVLTFTCSWIASRSVVSTSSTDMPSTVSVNTDGARLPISPLGSSMAKRKSAGLRMTYWITIVTQMKPHASLHDGGGLHQVDAIDRPRQAVMDARAEPGDHRAEPPHHRLLVGRHGEDPRQEVGGDQDKAEQADPPCPAPERPPRRSRPV